MWKRRGIFRWFFRVPQFFSRKGELFDRVEHLIYSEHWEYPTTCTWREVKQATDNSPYECVRRVKALKS
jgi:hypothetical protein